VEEKSFFTQRIVDKIGELKNLENLYVLNVINIYFLFLFTISFKFKYNIYYIYMRIINK